MPSSLLISVMSFKSSADELASRDENGSSAIMRAGSWIRHIAMATRWRWPPESSLGWRDRYFSPRPHSSRTAIILAKVLAFLSDLEPMPLTVFALPEALKASSICHLIVWAGFRQDTGSWKIAPTLVLFMLNKSESGVLRFNEMNRMMTDCSQKMLSQTLRNLEHYNLVHREVYPQVPPKVEYSLTETGKSLMPVIMPLIDWAIRHFDDVVPKAV